MKEFRNVQISIDDDTNKELDSWSKRGWDIVNISNPILYEIVGTGENNTNRYYMVVFSRELKTTTKEQLTLDTDKYFTEKEVQDFKDGSIKYPLIIFDKHQHNVTEVSQITAINGMPDNDGIPVSIAVQVHRKDKPVKYLTYKLQK